ncbi:DUF3343 domain-containing protein [bacterium]|nr:DUF3343 domain-containing protein [bacterium]
MTKRLWLVITFPSTTAAMAMESYCQKHDLPGRLIPVPTSITAECGMCWRAPIESRDLFDVAVADDVVSGGCFYELWL